MFNLCIQANSLFSLMDFDFCISLDHFDALQDMNTVVGLYYLPMADKVPGSSGVLGVLYVIYVTLEPIHDSVQSDQHTLWCIYCIQGNTSNYCSDSYHTSLCSRCNDVCVGYTA